VKVWKINWSLRGAIHHARLQSSRAAVSILLSAFFASLAYSIVWAQESIKLTIYELPEQDACGAVGYRPKQPCPVQWNEETFKRLKSELTPVLKPVSIPPYFVQLTQHALEIILPYSPVASRASLENRESALFVFEWPDKTPRNFTIIRPASPHVLAGEPFHIPVTPWRTRYYNEPLDHIDPTNQVIWYLTSGSNKYKLMFER
jgi:hypothetical protein